MVYFDIITFIKPFILTPCMRDSPLKKSVHKILPLSALESSVWVLPRFTCTTGVRVTGFCLMTTCCSSSERLRKSFQICSKKIIIKNEVGPIIHKTGVLRIVPNSDIS